MKVVDILFPDLSTPCQLPVAGSRISAGFPSPADDFIENSLDLNLELIKNPTATFFVRVSGSSMKDAGIFDGDILIVDRSLRATNRKIVIAILNGELLVKRLCIRGDQYILMPENKNYSPIYLTNDSDLNIWGVVTNVIHKV
jgi:DNA polymerase V